MKVRKLDANGDQTFGNGMANFWINHPDGVAQTVVTRLRLQEGEWYLDTREGTPWKTAVLGKHTEGTRDFVMRTRITATEGVKELRQFNSQLDRESRAYSVQAEITTIYGNATLSGQI